MNETFKGDLKKKMVLIKLLRGFAEDRNVEAFAKSLKMLLEGCHGESLVSDLRWLKANPETFARAVTKQSQQ